MKKRIFIVVMFCVFFLSALVGCRFQETEEEKIKDLDYTICDDGKLPQELVKIIEKKKTEPFKLTYRTKEYLYIVVGYGAQDRTDLDVLLTELYLTKNAIFVDTDLVSKEDEKLKNDLMSYPYIAVKCELYDQEVTFK
ncbi:MAG: protease complex subunit PrcB family protein [Eubacteriales bacterium]|nr:protease complex subunit PrcB family protein [Eubacteriales bacterium]